MSSSWSWRRLATIGTLSSRVSAARISSVASSSVTYRLTAGQSRPAVRVKACTTSSGSIVSLPPGMYTVDMRSRATRSTASSGASASAGAAMWMPKITLPLPRPRTDSASSISVVWESSMEKACTGAAGRSWAGTAGTGSGGGPVPFGNCSNRKRRQWNW